MMVRNLLKTTECATEPCYNGYKLWLLVGYLNFWEFSWQRNNIESRTEKDFQTSNTTQRPLLMNKRGKRSCKSRAPHEE
jgi:hypothetical protein